MANLDTVEFATLTWIDWFKTRRVLEPIGYVPPAEFNALAESVIGLFKTEVIRRQGPWRNLDTVEFATLTWIDWFNTRRVLEPIGYVPPAEFEARYHEQVAMA